MITIFVDEMNHDLVPDRGQHHTSAQSDLKGFTGWGPVGLWMVTTLILFGCAKSTGIDEPISSIPDSAVSDSSTGSDAISSDADTAFDDANAIGDSAFDKEGRGQNDATLDAIVDADQPTSDDAQPTSNDAQPTSNDAQPTSNDAQPTSNDAQPDQNGDAKGSCEWELVYPEIGTKTLRALWGSSEEDVYAVGDNGTLLHYDGTEWKKIEIGYDDVDLIDIWGSDKNNIYAIGNSHHKQQELLHFDGQSWEQSDQPFVRLPVEVILDQERYYGIWGSSADNVYIAGENSIWHFDGSTWSQSRQSDMSHVWTDVYGCGSNTIFAVDHSTNELYQWDGTNWHSVHTVPNEWYAGRILSIFCGSDEDIWLLSYYEVYHYNGESWLPLYIEAPETSAYQITDIFETDDGQRFLIGNQGVLLKWEDNIWQRIPTETSENLFAIWGADSDELFLAGDHGVLIRVSAAEVQTDNRGMKSGISDFADIEGDDGFAAVNRNADLLIGDAQQQGLVMNTDYNSFFADSLLALKNNDIYVGGYHCPDDIRDLGTSSWHPFYGSPALMHYNGTRFSAIDLGIPTIHLIDFAQIGSGPPVFVDMYGRVGLFKEGEYVEFSEQPPLPALFVSGNESDELYVLSSPNRRAILSYQRISPIPSAIPVVLYRYENGNWLELASIDIEDMVVDMIFGGDGELYIVGISGSIYQYIGDSFQRVTESLPEQLLFERSGIRMPMTLEDFPGFYYSTVVNAADDIYIAPGLFHYNGVGWESVILGDLGLGASSVFQVENGDMFAVYPYTHPKSGYTIAKLISFNDSHTGKISIPDEMYGTVAAIWGKSASDLYLATNGAKQIWYYNGSTWTVSETPIDKNLSFVESSGEEIWAASHKGDVFHKLQEEWVREYKALQCNTIVDLQQIGNQLIAMCDTGEVLMQEDIGWHLLGPDLKTEDGLEMCGSRMWVDSPNNIFVYGAPICHYNGENWSVIPEFDVRGNPYAVWGKRDEVYALYMDIYNTSSNFCAALIAQYDGGKWTEIACANSLEAVNGASEWMTSGPGVNFLVPDTIWYPERDTFMFYDGLRWNVESGPDLAIQWYIGNSSTEVYTATREGSIYYRNCQ